MSWPSKLCHCSLIKRNASPFSSITIPTGFYQLLPELFLGSVRLLWIIWKLFKVIKNEGFASYFTMISNSYWYWMVSSILRIIWLLCWTWSTIPLIVFFTITILLIVECIIYLWLLFFCIVFINSLVFQGSVNCAVFHLLHLLGMTYLDFIYTQIWTVKQYLLIPHQHSGVPLSNLIKPLFFFW